jgi:ribonuclease HI
MQSQNDQHLQISKPTNPKQRNKGIHRWIKNTSPNNTSFAVYIPELEFELTGSMTQGASIFSAEAFAIAQALKFIYQLEDHPPEVIVYSDSSTAIKTISSNTHSDNAAVATSRELIASLRSSGTLTTLA